MKISQSPVKTTLQGFESIPIYDPNEVDPTKRNKRLYSSLLKGQQGDVGPAGPSAYAVWISNGSQGTQQDFLNSLIGPTGASAYQAWLNAGNVGTVQDFLDSLQGEDGLPGYPGSAWLADSVVPNVNIGIDGDFYLNTQTGNVYRKDTGVWGLPIANLKGPQGDQGTQGIPGTNGEDGVQGADGREIELNTSLTHLQWRLVGDLTWIDLLPLSEITGPEGASGADGNDGADGSMWYSGEAAPSDILGNHGDYYLRSTGDVYGPKAAGIWGSPVFSLKGENGQNGSNGWHVGNTAPSSGLGINGDLYLNSATGDLYGPKAAGAWGAIVGNLRGPQGNPGTDGQDGSPGTNGTPGSVWFMGAVDPHLETGVPGDFYLNTTTGDIFGPKTIDWGVVSGNIRGPQGTQGIQGVPGEDGADGADGASGLNGLTWVVNSGPPDQEAGVNGDLYFDIDTGNVYGPKVDGEWGPDPAVELKGPQGEPGLDGPSGAPGSRLLHGTAVPQPTDGVDGDWFLRTDTGDLYGPKASNTWPASELNLRGPQGIPGINGENLDRWFYNNTDPIQMDGVWGDFHLNTVTGAIFLKNEADEWENAAPRLQTVLNRESIALNASMTLNYSIEGNTGSAQLNPQYLQFSTDDTEDGSHVRLHPPTGTDQWHDVYLPAGNGVLALRDELDALAPATVGTAVLKANGTGGFADAVSGVDYAPAVPGTSGQLLTSDGNGLFGTPVAATVFVSRSANNTGLLLYSRENGTEGVTSAASFDPAGSSATALTSAQAYADALVIDSIANSDTTHAPSRNAVYDALQLKLDASAVGVSIAPLVGGLVPAENLPSYVDDVIEVDEYDDLPVTGEVGKIYVVKLGESPTPDNAQYRWSGSGYVQLVASPGTTTNVPEGSNLYFTDARARGAVVTASISDGDTTHSPSGEAIFEALALKASISSLAASATTDTTNASNISSGVLAAARGGAGTVAGLLKADGSGNVSGAAAGTDYATATNGTSTQLLTSNGTGGFGTAVNQAIFVARSANNTGLQLYSRNSGTEGVTAASTFETAGAAATAQSNAQTFASNASNISSGTLAAARGGAGTVSGILKANGSGLVSAAVSGTDYETAGAAATAQSNAQTFAANASNISSGTLAAARGGAGAVNGLMKANGSGVVSVAVAGTDYAVATNGTSGQALVSNGSGGFGTPVTLGTLAAANAVSPPALGGTTPAAGTFTNLTMRAGATTQATLDSELVTNGTFATDASGWALGTDWTYDGVTDTASCALSGSSGTLSQTITVPTGGYFVLSFTMTHSVANNCELSAGFDGSSFTNIQHNVSVTQTVVALYSAAAGSRDLVFTVNNLLGGTMKIGAVSLKRVLVTNAVAALQTNATSVFAEIRGHNNGNLFLGNLSGRATTSASTHNTLLGNSAGANLSSGLYNSLFGSNAGADMVGNIANTAGGYFCARRLLSGNHNSINGYAAAQFWKVASSSVVMGSTAANFLNDGATTFTNASSGVYLGFDARGLANGEANAIVIGSSALGQGSNTTVIGKSTTTKNRIFGQSLGPVPTVVSASTKTQSTQEDMLIFATSATCTLTLLSAATYLGAKLFVVTRNAFAVNSASSNVVPLLGGSAGTAILPALAGAWAILESDGTNWNIILADSGVMHIAGTETITGAKTFSAALTASSTMSVGNNLTVAGSIARSTPVTVTAATASMGVTDSTTLFNTSATCTYTLLSAATYPGRDLRVVNYAAQLINSASSNVIPMTGGAAGTAILPATAGAWALLSSDGTNWRVIQRGS